jgi:hypothetical protein
MAEIGTEYTHCLCSAELDLWGVVVLIFPYQTPHEPLRTLQMEIAPSVICQRITFQLSYSIKSSSEATQART